MSPKIVIPKKLQPMPMPWEQQPDESDEAYQAFIIFRDAGKNRSVDFVAKSRNCNQSLIYRWRMKFNWHERARLWDRELDNDYRQGLANEKIKASKETIELGRAIRGKAAEALNKLIDDKIIIDKKEIPTWAELGVRLERLALGDSNININTNDETRTGLDIDAIIRNPKALKAALELDEALGQGEAQSVEPDDSCEPDVAESETPESD